MIAMVAVGSVEIQVELGLGGLDRQLSQISRRIEQQVQDVSIGFDFGDSLRDVDRVIQRLSREEFQIEVGLDLTRLNADVDRANRILANSIDPISIQVNERGFERSVREVQQRVSVQPAEIDLSLNAEEFVRSLGDVTRQLRDTDSPTISLDIGELRQQLGQANELLQSSIDDVNVQLKLDAESGGATRELERLTSEVLKAKSALADNDIDSAALNSQSQLLQEQLRFRKEIERLRGSGFSKEDINAAEQLAAEINSLNVARIEKEFEDAAQAIRRVEDEAQQAASAIDRAEDEAQKFEGTVGGLGDVAQGVFQGVGQELFDSIANALDGVKDLIADFVGDALNNSRELGAELNRFGSLTNLANGSKQLEEFRDRITQIGIETSKTPQQAAAAGNALLSLGSDAKQATERVSGVVALDEATGLDNPELAAQTIQTGLNVFEKLGETSDSLADKIAKLRASTAANVQDVNQLLSTSGGLASSLGVDFNEFAANFATLRDSGQTAEVGATSIKNLLLGLSDTAKAQKALGDSTFSAFDDGEFIGINAALEELQSRLSSLDAEDQVPVLKELVGADAVSGVQTLLAEIEGKTAEVQNNLAGATGFSAEASQRLLEGLDGSLQLLEGSLETFSLGFGDAIEPIATAGAKGLTDFVNGLLETEGLLSPLEEAAAGFVEVLQGDDLDDVFTAINAEVRELIDLLIGNLAGGLENIAELIEENPDTIERMVQGFGQLLADTLQFAANVGEVVKFFIEIAAEVERFKAGFDELVNGIVAKFPEPLQKVLDIIGKVISRFTSFTKQLDGLKRGFAEIAEVSQNIGLGSDRQAGAGSLGGATAGDEGGVFSPPDFTSIFKEQASGIAEQGKIAQAESEKITKEQEKAAKKALDVVKQANADAEAEIKRSQNARVAAIKQEVLDKTKTEQQAAKQIAAIEQDTIAQTIAQKQKELAKFQELAQGKTEAAADAAAQEAKLTEEISRLNLERIEKEIEARRKLAEEQIKAQFEPVRQQLEGQQNQLGIQGGAVQGELDLLAAQQTLQQSLNQLEQEQLNTQIAQAQADGDKVGAEQLKLQLVELQAKQEQEQFEIAQQQLNLKQELANIEAQRQLISAQIAANEAEQALLLAQAAGEDERSLALKKQALDLQKQNVTAAEDLVARQEKINDREQQSLKISQKLTKERQEQARIQAQSAADKAALEDGLGDLGGSGSSAGGGGRRFSLGGGSSGGGRAAGGGDNENAFTRFSDSISNSLTQVANSTINDQANSASSFFDALASKTASFLGVGGTDEQFQDLTQALKAANKPFEELKSTDLTGLNLEELNKLASGVEAGTINTQKLGLDSDSVLSKLDSLIQAIANNPSSPTFIAQSPDPTRNLAAMSNNFARSQARSLGLA